MKLRILLAASAALLTLLAADARADFLITGMREGDEPAILHYSNTGTFLGVFADGASLNVEGLNGLVRGPSGDLFATSNTLGSDTIERFNGTTGSYKGAFVPGISPS